MTTSRTATFRWFRFSLRTLFVAVTLLAGWLAYEANWLRQRRAALTPRPLAPGSKVWVQAQNVSSGPVRAPGLLWIFGEKGIDELWVNFYFPDRGSGEFGEPSAEEAVEAERIHRLFPETSTFRDMSVTFTDRP